MTDKEKRIAVVDVDAIHRSARFPNLACMKMVGYYRKQGHTVDFYDTEYPCVFGYDTIYCSKVFTETPFDLKDTLAGNIVIGGTGFYFDKAEPLPYDIEHSMPAYGIYHRKETEFTKASIGFTTRGCIRGCKFCVNQNSRAAVVHSPVKEFLNKDLPGIILCDDNVFACKEWANIWADLAATNKPFIYKQGLDIRLLDAEKAEALRSCKWWFNGGGEIFFAFDDYRDKDLIIRKLDLLRSVTSRPVRFYCICGFKSVGYDDLAELFERICILNNYNALPYVCKYKKDNEPVWKWYTAVARWTNQPAFYRKQTLRQYIEESDHSEHRTNVRELLENMDNDLLKRARII